jgi:hypothetical protein
MNWCCEAALTQSATRQAAEVLAHSYIEPAEQDMHRAENEQRRWAWEDRSAEAELVRLCIDSTSGDSRAAWRWHQLTSRVAGWAADLARHWFQHRECGVQGFSAGEQFGRSRPEPQTFQAQLPRTAHGHLRSLPHVVRAAQRLIRGSRAQL